MLKKGIFLKGHLQSGLPDARGLGRTKRYAEKKRIERVPALLSRRDTRHMRAAVSHADRRSHVACEYLLGNLGRYDEHHVSYFRGERAEPARLSVFRAEGNTAYQP